MLNCWGAPFFKRVSPKKNEQSQLHYVVAEIVLERFAEDERGVTVADRGVVTEAGATELQEDVLEVVDVSDAAAAEEL